METRNEGRSEDSLAVLPDGLSDVPVAPQEATVLVGQMVSEKQASLTNLVLPAVVPER